MALAPNTLVLQRDRVRLLIQEPTAQYWTNAVLDLYINEAQFDIAVGSVPGTAAGMEEPILGTEATTASVAAQEFYSLPPNFHAIRIVRVRQTSTDTYTEIPQIDIEYARAHSGGAAIGDWDVPKPQAWYLWGESGTYQIGMFPAFDSANGSIYVSYWRRPTEMTSDSATLQIPLELLVANTYLAAWKAMFERGHYTEADKLLQTFDYEYKAKLSFVRRRLGINTERAISLGSIGDTDTDRVLY